MDNDLFSEKVKKEKFPSEEKEKRKSKEDIKLEENRKYIKSMLISLDELESKIKKL